MRAIFLWISFCIAGCDEPPPPDPRPAGGTTPELVYARGRDALATEGITTLRWGLTPFVSTTSVATQNRPTLELVATRLGVPIDIVVADNYGDLETKLLEGEIDVATMSPYAYVQAKRMSSDIQVFATHISDGAETYGGYIVTHETREVHTVKDVRGLKFAYVDPRSSSGWLFPASRLLDAGIHPVDDVDGMFYGSHAAVIQAVVSGRADVGATYGGALEQGRSRIPGAENLRIIARTQRIPFDAYVARAGLPGAGRDAIQAALASVSTRDSAGRNALSSFRNINGFMPALDPHYKGVRTVDEEVSAALEASGNALPPLLPIEPPASP